MEDRIDNKSGRFPGVGDIPLVGEIFTTRNNASSKSELVILLGPTVIKDAALDGDFGASPTRCQTGISSAPTRCINLFRPHSHAETAQMSLPGWSAQKRPKRPSVSVSRSAGPRATPRTRKPSATPGENDPRVLGESPAPHPLDSDQAGQTSARHSNSLANAERTAARNLFSVSSPHTTTRLCGLSALRLRWQRSPRGMLLVATPRDSFP